MLAQVTLDQALEYDAGGVKDRADARQDQHDREDLAGRVERVDFPEADGRDGGDGLVSASRK